MVCLPKRTKKLWPGHESAQTDGQTDRQTDRQTEYMTHRLMVMHTCAKYRMSMTKNKEVMVWTRIHVKKTDNFDLEVKSQGHTEVIHIRDTSSHSDTPICQIWYAYLKE